MKISKLSLIIASVLTVNAVNAEEGAAVYEDRYEHNRLGFQLSAGFGGDSFLDATVTSSTGEISSSVDAGDIVSYGVYYLKSDLIADLSGKFALNSIQSEETYSNGEESFSRTSFDFLLMKELPNHYYIGAGVTYHLNPTYEFTLNGSSTDTFEEIEYDPALGYMVEFKKIYRNGLEYGFSYTNIEYTGGTKSADSDGSVTIPDTIDGSSFALTIGFSF